MSLRFLVPVLFAVSVTATPLLAQNPSQQGHAHAGRGEDTTPSGLPTNEGAAQEYFNQAQQYDDSGSTAEAIAAYHSFLKQYPASKLAARAQFRVAQLLQSQNNLARAFDAYDTLVTRYPDTPEFEQAVTQEVIIANKYMAQERIRIAGFSLLPGYEKAQTMYERILKSAPYSKHAPVAQFNLGLSLERQKKAREAMDAYQVVLDKYPNTDVADDAFYQIAYVNMRVGLTGRSQDLSSLVLAKEQFEDFLLQYPNSEKVAQAKDNLKTIGARESGELLSIAKYYDWMRNYKSAAIYYNAVIKRQPGTDDAKVATTRVQELNNQYGDEVTQTSGSPDTGEKTAMRRRLAAEVESNALSDYNGPSKSDIVPDQLPVARPQMRTNIRDQQPMGAPPVEPLLPSQ